MIGSDEEGDFSLRISPVHLEDDAEYQCQVASATELPLRSQVARLTVFAPPDRPSVTQPPVATAGVPLTLTCASKGGRPAPEVRERERERKRKMDRQKVERYRENERSERKKGRMRGRD